MYSVNRFNFSPNLIQRHLQLIIVKRAVLNANSHLRFDAEFAKIHMTKKRILTLTIFVTVAILWIFGGYINPILSQLLGLPKPIGSFDSMVALSAAIVICVTGIASWKEVQDNTEMGRIIPLWWRLNLKFCTHPFRCK